MPADEVPSYWAESPLKRVARPDGFRVGGRPYLLQEIQPPVCEHCGNVMAFIAQAPLTRPLKMSDSFDVAYAFMCDRLGKRICPSFKPFSGANALLLQRGGGKGRAGCDATAKYPEYGFRLRKHCEPLGGDPNIHVGDDFVELVFSGTKLGGVPAWAQGDETPACPACGKRMGLIAQVSSCIDWPEEGRNLLGEAMQLMISKRVKDLTEGKTKHVIIRIDPNGHELLAVEPDDEHTPGGVTIVGEDKAFTPARSDFVFPFGDAGVAHMFMCSCGSDQGAFMWGCS